MKKIAIFGGSFNPPGLHHYQLLDHQADDFSSSLIRGFLSQGEPITHLVVPAVESYIRQNRLYR